MWTDKGHVLSRHFQAAATEFESHLDLEDPKNAKAYEGLKSRMILNPSMEVIWEALRVKKLTPVHLSSG